MAYAVPTGLHAGVAYLLVWQGCCILLCCVYVCVHCCCVSICVCVYVPVCMWPYVGLCPFMFDFCARLAYFGNLFGISWNDPPFH